MHVLKTRAFTTFNSLFNVLLRQRWKVQQFHRWVPINNKMAMIAMAGVSRRSEAMSLCKLGLENDSMRVHAPTTTAWDRHSFWVRTVNSDWQQSFQSSPSHNLPSGCHFSTREPLTGVDEDCTFYTTSTFSTTALPLSRKPELPEYSADFDPNSNTPVHTASWSPRGSYKQH